MLRVRLKADGRLVEVLPDGSERPIASDPRAIASAAHNAARAEEARYARNVRGRTGLTQAAFAARSITLFLGCSNYDPNEALSQVRAMLAHGVEAIAVVGEARSALARLNQTSG